MAIESAVVSALGGLASSVLGFGNSERQREYDYQMWLKQQEYNKPVNQVKRLQEAGLNPALALNQITSGNADSHAGGQQPYDFSPLQQGLESAGTIMSQQDLVKAQAAEHSANAELQSYNVAMADAREKRAIETYLLDLQERKARILASGKDNALKDAQIRQIDSQIESSNAELDFFKQSMPERLRAIKLQNNRLQVQNALDLASKKYVEEQTRWYGKLSKTQIDSMYKQMSLWQQQINNLVVEGKLTDAKEVTEWLQQELMSADYANKSLNYKEEVDARNYRNKDWRLKDTYDLARYLGDILSTPLRFLIKK